MAIPIALFSASTTVALQVSDQTPVFVPIYITRKRLSITWEYRALQLKRVFSSGRGTVNPATAPGTKGNGRPQWSASQASWTTTCYKQEASFPEPPSRRLLFVIKLLSMARAKGPTADTPPVRWANWFQEAAGHASASVSAAERLFAEGRRDLTRMTFVSRILARRQGEHPHVARSRDIWAERIGVQRFGELIVSAVTVDGAGSTTRRRPARRARRLSREHDSCIPSVPYHLTVARSGIRPARRYGTARRPRHQRTSISMLAGWPGVCRSPPVKPHPVLLGVTFRARWRCAHLTMRPCRRNRRHPA